MKELNNPFVVYGYKGAAYFCDREAETEKIVKGLSNERNITLIAPRRIGKTGLIHHVFANIREQQPNICCIYFDILATKTLDQFVQLMARTLGDGSFLFDPLRCQRKPSNKKEPSPTV